jgi:hypothetical protein
MPATVTPVPDPVDPYGSVIRAIRALIRQALEHHEGAMSDAEHANLVSIEEFVRGKDNA